MHNTNYHTTVKWGSRSFKVIDLCCNSPYIIYNFLLMINCHLYIRSICHIRQTIYWTRFGVRVSLLVLLSKIFNTPPYPKASRNLKLENKCVDDERECNTGRKQTLACHSAYTIQKLPTFCNCCYRVRQKPQKIATKIAKNTRFEIPPFVLPPIGALWSKL